MRLRIVSLLSLACASALLVTGCNQSIVGTNSGTPGGNGASYVYATNFNTTTQEGTIQSFPITSPGISLSAVAPAATTVYPGEVSTIAIGNAGSGLSVAPTITIAPPVTTAPNGGTTATAVATLGNFPACIPHCSVQTVTITNPGSGYTAAPIVSVSAAAGTVAPVFTATVATPFAPLTTYTSQNPIVPTYLNAGVYNTQLSMDSVADGRIYFASYPASLPNVASVHLVTATNPSTVTASNGIVTGLTLTAGGAGYVYPPAVVIAPPSAPGGIPATATATVSSSAGPVSSVTVTANGAGYTSTPTVTFAAPTTVGGTTATGTAVCSASCGTVTGITMTNAGSGYVTAPAITFSVSGSTTSAAATAAVAAPFGVVTGLTLTNPGSGYTTTNPSVTISAPYAASATATVSGGAVSAITVNNGGTGYTTAPGVTIAPPSGTVAAPTATGVASFALSAPGNITQLDVLNPGADYTSAPAVTIGAPTMPAATTTINGLGTVTSVTVTNGSFSYPSAPTVTFPATGVPGGVTATGTATINGSGVVTGVTITNGGLGYLTAPTPAFSTNTATATATIAGGLVTGFTIVNAGSGYTDTPTVTVAAPTPTAATATATLNGAGTVTGITITNAGTGYTNPPLVTIAANGQVQATATAAAVGPVAIGTLGISRVVTDALASNFKSMAVDRSADPGNVYVSEANGHMVVLAGNTGGGTIALTVAGTPPIPPGVPVDFDMSTDVGGSGASNTGFDVMTTDLDNNLYTYVAGAGVITEFAYNPGFAFPPFTTQSGAAGTYCAGGTSQCFIGSTAVTTPPVFPTANYTITLPASITNVKDFVIDLFGNLYVLSQNGGAGLGSITELAPCPTITTVTGTITTVVTASCTPTVIKTIGGANTGLNLPGSLAIDNIDNVYVEDFLSTSPTLSTFSIFTSNESGNVAPSVKFTETVPNTAPGGGTPSGYGLAVY